MRFSFQLLTFKFYFCNRFYVIVYGKAKYLTHILNVLKVAMYSFCCRLEYVALRYSVRPVLLFPEELDRLDSHGDATVTGGTSIAREKKKEKIRAKGPVSLQLWYVHRSASTLRLCVTETLDTCRLMHF